MQTRLNDGNVYQMKAVYEANYADCGVPYFGVEFVPTNGSLYISHEHKWFTTEQARDAFMSSAAL